MTYTLYIGGTEAAKKRWKSGRRYSTKRAAKRRMKQIRNANDLGVETIWILYT